MTAMKKRPQIFLRRFIALSLGMATLCSCSRVKLAYPFANLYVSSQAHHYLKLDSDQEKVLQSQIKAYMAWHRRQMLPAYAAACRKLSRGLKGLEPAKDNIEAMTPILGALYADGMEPLIKPTAKLLAGLDSKQVDFLDAAMQKEVSKQRQKILDSHKDPEKVKSIKRTLGYIEDFAGPLSREQKEKIKALSLAVHVPAEAWLLEREKRDKRLMELLRGEKNQEALEAWLKEAWLRGRMSESKSDPDRVNAVGLKAYFLGVLEVLTPQQRVRAAEVLEDYARDFEELAGLKAGD
jgi:hypothetical protein